MMNGMSWGHWGPSVNWFEIRGLTPTAAEVPPDKEDWEMNELDVLKRIARSGDRNDIYDAYLRDQRDGAYGADRADYQRLMDGADQDATEMEYALDWAKAILED